MIPMTMLKYWKKSTLVFLIKPNSKFHTPKNKLKNNASIKFLKLKKGEQLIGDESRNQSHILQEWKRGFHITGKMFTTVFFHKKEKSWLLFFKCLTLKIKKAPKVQITIQLKPLEF